MALLVRPSRIPHRISKIIFILGSYEFLAMLDGKIRETPFFKVQSGEITVCFALGQKIESVVFFAKNLANFVSLPWKLNNPCLHAQHLSHSHVQCSGFSKDKSSKVWRICYRRVGNCIQKLLGYPRNFEIFQDSFKQKSATLL